VSFGVGCYITQPQLIKEFTGMGLEVVGDLIIQSELLARIKAA
jgi:hypothetical protein